MGLYRTRGDSYRWSRRTLCGVRAQRSGFSGRQETDDEAGGFTVKHALIWGVVSAVAVTALQALITFDALAVTDWRVWAVGLGSAAVRSGAQAALQAILTSRE